ncbi:hypothetical protein FHR23_002928 [Stakelama sediminis]|uniref:Uncharacterized protein n=1 Tax=Stakelama sediminis TaxID=463200 RepID=A0A840Z2E2_9SPHN|nr:hypothetical protein [Stakelama sediminis]MBB5719969.1 hypothetical protein [Stakelama sediminis]
MSTSNYMPKPILSGSGHEARPTAKHANPPKSFARGALIATPFAVTFWGAVVWLLVR